LTAVTAVADAVGVGALDVLGRLIDKSLVVANRAGREYRYRLLESIREYGRRLLAERGEVERANTAMLGWVLGLVAQLERDMRTPRQDKAITAVQPELATARAAYEWALETTHVLTALRILSTVPIMPTGQRFAQLERLRHTAEDAPRPLRAHVDLTLANLAGEAGEADAGISHAVAAAEAFDALGDPRLNAWARYFEAMLRWSATDDTAVVSRLITAALGAFDTLGDELGLAYTFWVASLLTTDTATARSHAERSVAQFRELASPFGLAHSLEGRALIELAAGDQQAAIGPLEERSPYSPSATIAAARRTPSRPRRPSWRNAVTSSRLRDSWALPPNCDAR
jgi:non-specific serine/threonine protein kinase